MSAVDDRGLLLFYLLLDITVALHSKNALQERLRTRRTMTLTSVLSKSPPERPDNYPSNGER